MNNTLMCYIDTTHLIQKTRQKKLGYIYIILLISDNINMNQLNMLTKSG